jgi:hypothetical protein
VVVQGAGDEVRTPIWIVTVGPSVFVRSYRGNKGRWYQHVLARRIFPLEIEGTDVVVSAEPVTTATTNDDVSAAYKAKYPDEPETPDMVSSPVVATTLQLVPTKE